MDFNVRITKNVKYSDSQAITVILQ